MATLLFSDPIQTSDLPDALRVIYSTELEWVSRPHLMYDQFVETKDDFRVRRGETVYWTIYRQLPPAIAPLTENTDVDGGQMQDFQVSFTVNEYGAAIGTTEKLDLLSYQGPISNIVRQVLAPQQALTLDILARNAFFGPGTKYKSYVGTATARAGLGASDTITEQIVRMAAHNLTVRRVPLQGNSYMAICHPAITYDIRNLSYWKDAQLYSGAVNLFSGEVGMLHGVRFIEGDNARLPNAGAVIYQTTLTSQANPGDVAIQVANASGFAGGMEITLFAAAASTPDGTGATEEHLVVDSVVSNQVNLKSALQITHASADKVREGLDVFPVVFLGGLPALGKGVVVEPEVRVALPVDRLRRIHFVGWYGLLGYGVIRSWAADVWEMASAANSAPAFMW